MEKYWQPTRKKEYPNNILNITCNIDILSINLELLDKIKNLKKYQRLNSFYNFKIISTPAIINILSQMMNVMSVKRSKIILF